MHALQTSNSQGFEKTGLGERIANMFVKAMGKSTLGLAFGLNIAELILAPAMPSTSARAGGELSSLGNVCVSTVCLRSSLGC